MAALPAAALRLESVGEGVEAGAEPFAAVVDPDVFAEGDQGGEAAGRQRPEERVEFASGRGVSDALLADGGGAVEGEAEGVVVEQGEGQTGFWCGEAGGVQRGEEGLGEGEGVWSEGVAGLEQPGDAGMAFEDCP